MYLLPVAFFRRKELPPGGVLMTEGEISRGLGMGGLALLGTRGKVRLLLWEGEEREERKREVKQGAAGG